MSRLPGGCPLTIGPENRNPSSVSIGLRLTGNRCQCAACGLLFSSVREFDRHRTGAYARPGELTHKRRCLTPTELAELGWRTNAQGFWMQPRPGHAPVRVEAPSSPTPAIGVQGSRYGP
ncbi:hypothetical protein [Luteimonas panaciterrae]|uniref:FDXHR family putative zinc-binding protein n=1 Tax=Luteimonas panaciterrae TaxID=363885 RepID=UPI003CCD18EE